MTDSSSSVHNERIVDWAVHVFRPIEMVNQLVKKNYQDRLTETIYKFWLLPIGVSLLINAVILYSYGIDVEAHKAFSALTVVLDTVELVAECFILFGLLIAMGATVRVGDVFVCYTVIVIFSPLFTLLAAPNVYYRVSLLEQIKGQHLDFAASLKYFLNNAADLAKLINEQLYFPGRPILGYAYETLNILLKVILAESLTQLLIFDRLKTYAAVCIASIISAFPLVISMLAQVWLIYSYLK
jgi:hypothetical protein